MKKLLFITSLFLTLLTSCLNHHHHHSSHHDVKCYQTYTLTNDILFWYLMMSPNGSTYYYSSPTQINNYSNVNWSTDGTNFNQSESILIGTESVESNGFSDEMENILNSQESQGFEENYNSSSESSNSDNSSSESGGFTDDGGGNSSDGDSGGSE